MKILQLCKKFPYPLKDGEALAVTHLSKACSDLGAELDILSMNTPKHSISYAELPESFSHYQNVEFVKVDTRLKIMQAFQNLFKKESYNVSRFISKDYERQLVRMLRAKDYDIVQLETLYLAPYTDIIRSNSDAKIVMRSHNVESEIWHRMAQHCKLPFKKQYLQLLAKKLYDYEVATLNDFDLLVPISPLDEQKFVKMGAKTPKISIPIGLDSSSYQESYQAFKHKDLSLSFIGALDWRPNLEGLIWFIKHIWPSLLAKYPMLTFHIAGKNTPNWLRKKKWQNIVVHGEVPSASDFINKHPIMIVPLLSGSGMRVKILEGMALGKIVITTSVGLEGINAKDQEEVLIADTQAAFLAQIDYCINSQEKLYKIGMQARKLIEEQYDNFALAQTLLDTLKNLVARKEIIHLTKANS